MKIAEIRELSTEELVERLESEVKAYNDAKFNHHIAPVDNVSLIKKQRRDIARMKCELSQRNK